MSDVLLSIDIGIKTGLAVFGSDGRLLWVRSRNYGARARLKRDVGAVLREAGAVRYVALEGGGDIALPWISECERQGIEVLRISAEAWRNDLLRVRERRSGPEAKKHAGALARRIITASGAKRPTSLRHDAAEAICAGFWAVQQVGWLSPAEAERILRSG